MTTHATRRMLPSLIAVGILLTPLTAGSQEQCIVHPRIAAPAALSPAPGEVVTLVFVSSGGSSTSGDGTITLSPSGGTGGRGVVFRWGGTFRPAERFVIEISPVPLRTISADAATGSTASTTTTTVSPTRSVATRDAGTLTTIGATSHTTTVGAREHTIAGLESGRSYRWRIKAYNCGADAPFSRYTTFSVGSSDPAPIRITN